MVTVVIGGDLCPIGENRPHFEAGDARRLFNDLLAEFEEADLAIANLECPLVEKATPILKTGPVFGEGGECIRGIQQSHIELLNLANNHILDHGAAGLKNTLDVCARAGISTVGAGENLEAARRIFIRKLGNIRIGVLAMAEHEFSIATRDAWGANGLDPIDCVRNLRSHRDRFDYLIVLLHGGDEFHVPSPRIKDICHFLVEMGAGAVIVQHPHCLGGCEQYQGGHIVYGQGALLMDEEIYRDLKSFHDGFLVRLSVAEDGTSTMDLVPFRQSDPAPGARRMARNEEQQFRNSLNARSIAIQDDAFVQAQWLKFCEQHRHGYLSRLLGHNRVIRRLNARGFVTKFLYGRKSLLGARNAVCCETHREVLETLFNHGRV